MPGVWFDHIGIACESNEKSEKFWSLLGFNMTGQEENVQQGVKIRFMQGIDAPQPSPMAAINTDGLNLGLSNLLGSQAPSQLQQGTGQTTGSQPSPWDNLFDNLDGLTMDGMKKIAKDNDLPWKEVGFT